MATPLDLGLLKNFDIIFPFIFVLVVVYAVLGRTEWFKEKQGIAFLLGFVLAVMTLFSDVAIKTINVMAPWVVLLVIFCIFLLIAYQSMGIGEGKIVEVITGKEYGNTFAYWMLALLLIIGLGSLSYVISNQPKGGFTQLAGENATIAQPAGGETGGFWGTLFHPKVLGMALILLIAMFTIQKLASKPD